MSLALTVELVRKSRSTPPATADILPALKTQWNLLELNSVRQSGMTALTLSTPRPVADLPAAIALALLEPLAVSKTASQTAASLHSPTVVTGVSEPAPVKPVHLSSPTPNPHAALMTLLLSLKVRFGFLTQNLCRVLPTSLVKLLNSRCLALSKNAKARLKIPIAFSVWLQTSCVLTSGLRALCRWRHRAAMLPEWLGWNGKTGSSPRHLKLLPGAGPRTRALLKLHATERRLKPCRSDAEPDLLVGHVTWVGRIIVPAEKAPPVRCPRAMISLVIDLISITLDLLFLETKSALDVIMRVPTALRIIDVLFVRILCDSRYRSGYSGITTSFADAVTPPLNWHRRLLATSHRQSSEYCGALCRVTCRLALLKDLTILARHRTSTLGRAD